MIKTLHKESGRGTGHSRKPQTRVLLLRVKERSPDREYITIFFLLFVARTGQRKTNKQTNKQTN